MRFGIILIVSTILSGCASFPDRLNLKLLAIDIVDFEENSYFLVNSDRQKSVRISAPSLVLEFDAQAPFAYIKGKSRQAQFRCNILNSDGDIITDTEFGWVYFNGISNPPDSSVDYNSVYNDERFRYKAFLYRTLKAKQETNSKREYSLISEEYDHIKCHLVGVRIAGGFMYSNDIHITRNQLLENYEAYKDNRIDSGVQSLDEFLRNTKR